MICCGYCHAEIPTDEQYVVHDLRSHDGLARMRDTHALVCEYGAELARERGLDPKGCVCRIEEYEAVARRLGGR